MSTLALRKSNILLDPGSRDLAMTNAKRGGLCGLLLFGFSAARKKLLLFGLLLFGNLNRIFRGRKKAVTILDCLKIQILGVKT